jgi:hypothetical protein
VLLSAGVGIGIGYAVADSTKANSQGSSTVASTKASFSSAFQLNSGQSYPQHTTYVSYGLDQAAGALKVTFHAADTSLDRYGAQLKACTNRSVQVDEFGVLISAGAASPDRYLRITVQAQSSGVTAVLASIVSNPSRGCTSGVGSEGTATTLDASKIATSSNSIKSKCGATGRNVEVSVPISSIPVSASASGGNSNTKETFYRANFYHTAVHDTTTGQSTFGALVCGFENYFPTCFCFIYSFFPLFISPRYLLCFAL